MIQPDTAEVVLSGRWISHMQEFYAVVWNTKEMNLLKTAGRRQSLDDYVFTRAGLCP
ncbi:hypothetical protein KCP70_21910 [Salmonella enterica subsp. enterica]|nr:hypothetical protein KCP70_21910 [Salmonella enterica subsp. enterica]